MPSQNRRPTARHPPVPAWVPIAGAAFSAATLLFLMGLIIMSAFGHNVHCDNRFLVVMFLALGAATGSSFLGGTAAASGTLPVDYAQSHPVSFSVAGGVAVLVIILFAGNFVYGQQGCSGGAVPKLGRGTVILSDGFSRYNVSGFQFATDAVVAWNANVADILAAKPDGKKLTGFFLPYDAEHYKNPDLDANATAGILPMNARGMSAVSECPTDGYLHHWFEPRVGGIYCVRTRNGKSYAIIRVDMVDSDRIGFDYVYQPDGTNRF